MTDDSPDTVIRSYSEEAISYDSTGNLQSCWGQAAAAALRQIRVEPHFRTVVDVGCGTGQALRELASRASASARFVGVEPAEKMRQRAADYLKELPNLEVLDGRFEALPLESGGVDYLVSFLVFHWTTSPEQSVTELARVLGEGGEMDLFFTGRHTGQEFTARTTPIYLKYMGPAALYKSTGLRRHFTRTSAEALFLQDFPAEALTVTESLTTYYDDLEGHWSWWVPRTAGHFRAMPPDRRKACDTEVRKAIAGLSTSRGIPYTIHMLHVRVRP